LPCFLKRLCLSDIAEQFEMRALRYRRQKVVPGVIDDECFLGPLPAAPLLAVLTPEALELLGVLLREHPSSIRELVARTGRAQPNISRSLQLLARYNLVRLVREGREVRPEPVAKEVRVNLMTGTYEMTAAAA
jgi:predicted transcriptional regulator